MVFQESRIHDVYLCDSVCRYARVSPIVFILFSHLASVYLCVIAHTRVYILNATCFFSHCEVAAHFSYVFVLITLALVHFLNLSLPFAHARVDAPLKRSSLSAVVYNYNNNINIIIMSINTF